MAQEWSARDQLLLVELVQRHGTNWAPVVRQLKAHTKEHHPDDYFSNKSCAKQYAEFLDNANTPRRNSNRRIDVSSGSTPTNSRPGSPHNVIPDKQLSQNSAESITSGPRQKHILALQRALENDVIEYKRLKSELDNVNNNLYDETKLRDIILQYEVVEAATMLPAGKKIKTPGEISEFNGTPVDTPSESGVSSPPAAAREQFAYAMHPTPLSPGPGASFVNTNLSTAPSTSYMPSEAHVGAPGYYLNSSAAAVYSTEPLIPGTHTVSYQMVVSTDTSTAPPVEYPPTAPPVEYRMISDVPCATPSTTTDYGSNSDTSSLVGAVLAEEPNLDSGVVVNPLDNSVQQPHDASPREPLAVETVAKPLESEGENEADEGDALENKKLTKRTPRKNVKILRGRPRKTEVSIAASVALPAAVPLPTEPSTVVDTVNSSISSRSRRASEDLTGTPATLTPATLTPIATISLVPDVPTVEVSTPTGAGPRRRGGRDNSVSDTPEISVRSIKKRNSGDVPETGDNSSKSTKEKAGSTPASKIRGGRVRVEEEESTGPSSEPSFEDELESPCSEASSQPSESDGFTSDEEDDRSKADHKWKALILQAWSQIASHKNANNFRHPVTNKVAPGYDDTVLRPMDLGSIKKKVETGVIKSTRDFEHHIMLMFSNALMYNKNKVGEFIYETTLEMKRDTIKIFGTFKKAVRSARNADKEDRRVRKEKEKIAADALNSSMKGKRKRELDC